MSLAWMWERGLQDNMIVNDIESLRNKFRPFECEGCRKTVCEDGCFELTFEE